MLETIHGNSKTMFLIKVLTVNLRIKNKFQRSFKTKNFTRTPLLRWPQGYSRLGWVITLIEQVCDQKFFRQRELFWAHKLDNFYPNGLNHREIYAA